MRLSVKGLMPDTKYSVQVRSKLDGEVSEWSPKYDFTTITDERIPNTPTGVTWVKVEDAYQGDWDEVKKNTNGTNATIIRYEVELVGGPNSANPVRRIIGITKQTDDDPDVDKSHYNLSRAENKALFNGDYKKTVSFRVRAVNRAENKSPWSALITKDLGTPKAPTSVTWVPVKDAFHGEWNAVTKDTDESDATIDHYEVELTAGGNTVGANVGVQSKTRHSYDLSAARNVALFGSFQASVSFAVRAVSKGDVPSAWSTPITSGHVAPGPPTNAVVTTTPQGIKVSWTPPTDATNVATYKVRVATTQAGVATGTVIQNSSATEVTYTVNKSNIFTYYFRITSVSPAGIESTGLDCSGVPEQLVDTIPPGAPTGVSGSIVNAADGKTAKLTINWSFDTAPADMSGFRVHYKRVTDTAWQMVMADADMRTVTVDAFPYVDYNAEVQAIDKVGNTSAWAAGTITSPANTAPATVSGLTAQPSVDSITYSWTESTDADVAAGNGQYELQISTSNTFPTGASTVAYRSGLNSFTAAGLNFGTTYYARVRAIDSLGLAGAWSTTNTSTTNTPPATPLSDGNPPATSPAALVTGGIGYLYVDWLAISNADPVTYEVHVSTTSTFIPTLGSTTTLAGQTSATSIILEKTAAGAALAYGTTYYVRIIAKDKDTTSANAPAAGTVASGSPVKAASGDITSVSFGQVTTGSLGAETITIATGGLLKTANSEVQITSTGISVTGVNSSIVADAIETGSLTAGTSITLLGTMTVATNGWIQSNGYLTTGTAGYRLSATGLDVKSGTINAGALVTGSIGAAGAAGLTLTNGSYIQLTSGYIKGGGYTGTVYSATATTGFYFGNDGLRIGSGSISGAAISGDTIAGTNFTVNSGGSITGTGFTLSSSGLTVTSGTIGGISIQSSNIRATNGNFQINSDGSVSFLNGTFRGRIEATSGDFTGSISSAATITGGTFQTAASGDRVVIQPNGAAGIIRFYDSGGAFAGSLVSNTGPAKLVINGPGAGKLWVQDGMVEVWNADLQMNTRDILNVRAIGGDPAFNHMISGTGGERYVYTGNGGKLARGAATTSAAKYKTDINHLTLDLDAARRLTAHEFIHIGDEHLGKQAGFVADEADELGLTKWVGYNDEGGIEKFHYERWTAAQQVMIQHLWDKIDFLEQSLSELKA